MIRILVIEDDSTILKLLSSDLELEGYSVATAKDGVDGLEQAKKLQPDLIILDLMLPKMSGYDVCRSLRKDGSDIPILMLTARSQEVEKVVGFEQGADDYVTKPYGSMELIARVKALLRRHKRELSKVEQVTFADVTVNFKRMEAIRNGQPIALTAKEFQILELLIRYRGQVVSRRQFLEEIWGYEEMPTTRTVDNRVAILRQKLSPKNAEAYIVSIHGVGYKFIA
ncbi:MAG: response regulator transcription factor [Elusimicrobiota bacterium]|jgi:two-component system alkaline phosphatase synthesis response regulator PhoP